MRLSVQQAYVVLGVSSDASSDHVRQAYRKLALQFHPDKNPDPSATEKFQQLSAAYKRICDHQSRSTGGNGDDSDGDAFSDDNGGDLDDMDVSFEEMLMMFEMLFGQVTHSSRARNASNNNRKKKGSVNTKGKLPQVRVPRRGGRGGTSSRTGKARGFTNASLFGGGAEEMLFQSFMTMEMAREMSELENNFKSMSSFFGSNYGDSDYSFASDEDEGDEDFQAFANVLKQPKKSALTRQARPASGAKQEDPAPESKEPVAASDSIDATNLESKPSQSDLLDIELNVQVRVFGKHTGVVKFKGPVHYAKGEFLGVQLSEPLGKNDGRVKGVAYFDCPAQHGLMVRPEDVALVA